MAKKGNSTATPTLRFPEFRNANPWRTTPLERIASRVAAKNDDGLVTRFLTNSAEFGVLDQRDYFDRDIATAGKVDGYYIVDKGDFVYNPRISTIAPVGPISRNNLGKGVMSPLYTVFRFSADQTDFYEHYFRSTGWHSYLRSVASTGARHDRMSITTGVFMRMPVPTPSPEEQQKIAECLTLLDEVIASQGRKVKALKAYKRGLMQQLFPSEGETYPRLRFPEFRDAPEWKRKTLKWLANDFLDGDWIESKDQSPSGIRLVQTGNVGVGEFLPKLANARYVSEATFDRLNCTEVFAGDCLISRLPDPVGRACLVPDVAERMITAVDCTIVRFNTSQIIPSVFVSYSQTDQYSRAVESLSSGSTRTRISRATLGDIEIPLPGLQEQQRIANFLISLDTQITAESGRLAAFKTHKQGLMQQLFPAPEGG